MWKARRQIRTSPPPQRLRVGTSRDIQSNLSFSPPREGREASEPPTKADALGPGTSGCTAPRPASSPPRGSAALCSLRARGRASHGGGKGTPWGGGGERASRLGTSGVRLCAPRPAAVAARAPRGCWREGGRSREKLLEGGQSRRHKGRMLRPRARPLAPPGPRAGTHSEGMGRAAGERRRGVRPPLPPPSLALQPPPPPSLSFPHPAGQLRRRAKIPPCGRRRLITSRARQPRPRRVKSWALGKARVRRRWAHEAPARKGGLA